MVALPSVLHVRRKCEVLCLAAIGNKVLGAELVSPNFGRGVLSRHDTLETWKEFILEVILVYNLPVRFSKEEKEVEKGVGK